MADPLIVKNLTLICEELLGHQLSSKDMLHLETYYDLQKTEGSRIRIDKTISFITSIPIDEIEVRCSGSDNLHRLVIDALDKSKKWKP